MKAFVTVLLLLPAALSQTVCKDSSSECSRHGSNGLCNNAVTRDCMRRNCPLTCGVCRPPTTQPAGCKDLNRGCPGWAARYCKSGNYVKWMKKNCPKSCGYCGKTTVAPTKPPTGTCGRSTVQQSRIIAGVDAKPGAWPWMASLWMYGRSHICGGSLLNPKWVLTAAHCVVGTGASTSSLQIKLGEHNHRSNDGNEQVIGVERIISHSQYSRSSLRNDIALIKLKTPARLNSRVQTICIPARNSRPTVGSRECYLSGWGSIQHPGRSHHILQQAMLPVAAVSNCFNRADMVCTGFGRKKLTNACRGDSGGPYVCRRRDGSWEQHGVASFVVEYCKHYTAFTQVSSYIDWMNQYINDMS